MIIRCKKKEEIAFTWYPKEGAYQKKTIVVEVAISRLTDEQIEQFKNQVMSQILERDPGATVEPRGEPVEESWVSRKEELYYVMRYAPLLIRTYPLAFLERKLQRKSWDDPYYDHRKDMGIHESATFDDLYDDMMNYKKRCRNFLEKEILRRRLTGVEPLAAYTIGFPAYSPIKKKVYRKCRISYPQEMGLDVVWDL
jgi:hypothetical protein